jgi:hypothetical protein
MHAFLLALALSALPGPNPSSAPALKPPVSWPAKQVTFHLQDVPLRQAVEELFRGTGLKYVVQPDVPNAPISLHLRGVPFQTALRTLVNRAGLVYRLEGPPGAARFVCVIGKRQASDGKQSAAPLEWLTATLGPSTAVLEIVVPAALKPKVTVISWVMAESGAPDARPGVSPAFNVLIRLADQLELNFRQAQVKVIDAGANGERRIVITPLPAAAAPK